MSFKISPPIGSYQRTAMFILTALLIAFISEVVPANALDSLRADKATAPSGRRLTHARGSLMRVTVNHQH